MNEKIKDGDKVRIKENAFEGSTEPEDIARRGQVGEAEDLAYLGPDWVGCWAVHLENGSLAHVTVEEIEVVEDNL
jgi:hypothetical protein